jgi:hypothetical protein
MNEESEAILAALRAAVSEALDKKRRLEQYAVVWRDGRPAFIPNNDKVLVSAEPSAVISGKP